MPVTDDLSQRLAEHKEAMTEFDRTMERRNQKREEAEAVTAAGRAIGAEHWRKACDLLGEDTGGSSDVARARVHAQLAAIAFDNPIGVAKGLGVEGAT